MGTKSRAMIDPWSTAALSSLSDDVNEVQTLAQQFRDYAEGTSIHGIKYTCETGRPHVER